MTDYPIYEAADVTFGVIYIICFIVGVPGNHSLKNTFHLRLVPQLLFFSLFNARLLLFLLYFSAIFFNFHSSIIREYNSFL